MCRSSVQAAPRPGGSLTRRSSVQAAPRAGGSLVPRLRESGRRSAQLSLCLEVRDETAPAAYRVLLRGRRHGQQADVAVAEDPVAVLDAARQEDEPTIFKLTCVISAAEREVAQQHVEDLVFRRVSMVRAV